MGWLRKKKQIDSEKEDKHPMLTKEQIEEIDKVLEKHKHSEKAPEEENI